MNLVFLVAKRFLWCSWRHHIVWRKSWKTCLDCLATHVQKYLGTNKEDAVKNLPLFICGDDDD